MRQRQDSEQASWNVDLEAPDAQDRGRVGAGKVNRTTSFPADASLQLLAAPRPNDGAGAATRMGAWSAEDPSFLSALGLDGGASAPVVQASRQVASASEVAEPQDRGAIAADGVAAAGEPLPGLAALQPLFGHHDLSGLRAATDDAARAATEQLDAEAYAFGERVALSPGASLRTQAHEATHYLQQRAGKVHGHGVDGDPHEQEAEHIAAMVEQGKSVEAELDRLLGGPGGAATAQAVQCLTVTAANLPVRGGIPAVHAFRATAEYTGLLAALGTYEGNQTIGTAEAALVAAKACRAHASDATTYPLPVPNQPTPPFNPRRVIPQLDQLIKELHHDLEQRVRAVANDQTLTVGATAQLQTPRQRIDTAVAGLADPALRAKHKLILEFQQLLGFAGNAVPQVGATDGPAILQNWCARGDMYHAGAVLNLFPHLKLVIYDLLPPPSVVDEASFNLAAERAAAWKQACMIASYYAQPDRVFYTFGSAKVGGKGDAYAFHNAIVTGADHGAQRGMFLDVGGCTTVIGLHMQHARNQGALSYRQAKQDLAAAVGPEPAPQDDTRAQRQEIQGFLAQHGWQQNTKYVIVNYRASGHTQIEKQLRATPLLQRGRVVKAYNPATDQEGGNHPDLDTGIQGVEQLATRIRQRGFTPIFMGEEPAGQAHPHLIKYWEFEHLVALPAQDQQAPPPPVLKKLCRGGRPSEAFFLRVLAETYDVRSIAMRSGVTDQLAFLGIPTISIDVDNFHQAAAPELLAVPAFQRPSDEVAHSWGRGSKLEAGLERDYGRVFLEDRRDLKVFDSSGKWWGDFSGADEHRIDSAIDQYFGTAQLPATADLGIRHTSHPLHPDKLRATAVDHDAPLREALPGRIDSCLNPDVVLAHARSVLTARPPKVVEAKKFLDGHLEFTKVDRANVPAAHVAHLTDRLNIYLDFLGKAQVLLNPHGQGQAYQVQAQGIRQELRQNQQRLEAVGQSVQLLWEVHHRLDGALNRLFNPEAKKVAKQRRDFALLRLVPAPVLRALEDARPYAGVELAAAFRTRLLAVLQPAAPWLQSLQTICTEGNRIADPYYRRPFAQDVAAVQAHNLPRL
ncbi:MAG: DUF4157 domain-containing protein [Kofleriaceae bacterium]